MHVIHEIDELPCGRTQFRADDAWTFVFGVCDFDQFSPNHGIAKFPRLILE